MNDHKLKPFQIANYKKGKRNIQQCCLNALLIYYTYSFTENLREVNPTFERLPIAA